MSEVFANAGSPLRLPDTLDMNAARPLQQDLLQRRGAAIDLDGSSVSRIGGQCLQVLLAAEAAWAADGHAFRLAAASPELVEGLALLGAPHLAAHAALPADTGLDLFATAQD